MIAGHSADTQNIERVKAIKEQIKLADQFNRANTVVTLSTVSSVIKSDPDLRLNPP